MNNTVQKIIVLKLINVPTMNTLIETLDGERWEFNGIEFTLNILSIYKFMVFLSKKFKEEKK